MARGNFEVDITWENGAMTGLTILSNKGAECSISYPGLRGVTVRHDAESVPYTASLTADGTDLLTFPTTAGETYTITVPTVTITRQPQAESFFAPGAVTGTLEVAASASDGSPLSYQWYSGTVSDLGQAIPGAHGASYPLPAALSEGSYHFRCVVSAAGAAPVTSQAALVRVAANGGKGFTLSSQPIGKGDVTYLTADNALGLIYDGLEPFSDDKLTVDARGRLTLREGYVPLADETLSIPLTLYYYDSADAVYYEDFEGQALSPLTASTSAGQAGSYTQEKPGAYLLSAARALTGRQALTTGTASGALFRCFDTLTDGTITAWYYDACDDLGKNTTYDSTRFSVGVGNTRSNSLTSIVGVHYFKNGSAQVGSQDFYSGRDNQGANDSTDTPVPRSVGWHKIVWDIAQRRLTIDGVDTGYQKLPASVNTFHICTNWSAQNGALTYLRDKNFLDNVSVLPASAVRRSVEVTVTVRLLGDGDAAAVDAAVRSALAGSYTIPQAQAQTQAQAAAKAEELVGALIPDGVALRLDTRSYTAAVAGTRDLPAGSDGSYRFTAHFTKGDAAAQAELTLTITATAYVPGVYTVSFDLGYPGAQGAPAAQSVPEGQCALRPGDPEREGYLFTGWYLGDSAYDFTTPVMQDLTLTAHWEREPEPLPTEYTVTFDLAYTVDGDAQILALVTVEEGQCVARPQDPKREDYTFAGWYLGDTAYDFTAPVTQDLILTARWEEKPAPVDPEQPYTPPYSSGGGTAPTQPGDTSDVPHPNLTIVGGGRVKTAAGAGTLTYTLTPADGQALLYVRVNGILVSVPDSGVVTAGVEDSVVAVFGVRDTDHTRFFTDPPVFPPTRRRL